MSARRCTGPASRRPKPAGAIRRRASSSAWSRRSATVLDEAIEAGGSTLRDYAAADGALGYFQHSFAVYGREGEPCLDAGCRGVIERIVQAAARPSIVRCARR